jgi:parvulin-like peptidyl-prolyl isomerase
LRQQDLRKGILSVLAILLILGMAGCSSQKHTSPAIGQVNRVDISQAEFDQLYAMVKANYEEQQGAALDDSQNQGTITQIKDSVFEDLVIQKLVRQEAKQQGLEVSTQEIDKVLNNFQQAQNNSSADGYQQFMAKMKMSEADLRVQIETTLLYQKLQAQVAGNILVNDEETRKYYDDNPTVFQDSGGIQIYHVLVNSQTLAIEVIEKIKQGQDFAALTAQYSLDPGSKNQGGYVGLVNDNTNLVPEFKEAALALQPGQFTLQPVKSTYGYHIIKAGDKKPARELSFDEVKSQVKAQLLLDRQDQVFSNYLEDLKNKADIKDLRAK